MTFVHQINKQVTSTWGSLILHDVYARMKLQNRSAYIRGTAKVSVSLFKNTFIPLYTCQHSLAKQVFNYVVNVTLIIEVFFNIPIDYKHM